MARLIDKLNVLVKSQFTNLRGDSAARKRQPAKPPIATKDLAKHVAMLREQIDSALAQEDQTTGEIEAMQHQINEWDKEADAAIQANDEATARQLVRQIQITQQQRTMLQADLAQHRDATSELIRRVNELEAIIAENEQRDRPEHESTLDDAESLAERLRKARQMATGTREQKADTPTQTFSTTGKDSDVDEQAINNDITKRRERLSG